MRMSNEEYAAFVDSLSPRSPIWGDLLRAGLVGGAICVVGQALVNLYEHWGASAATAATWCSITLVFLGALLTGLGVYDDLARFAGAGSLVPITGLQTPWCPQRWNSRPRASSRARRPRSSRSQGR